MKKSVTPISKKKSGTCSDTVEIITRRHDDTPRGPSEGRLRALRARRHSTPRPML